MQTPDTSITPMSSPVPDPASRSPRRHHVWKTILLIVLTFGAGIWVGHNPRLRHATKNATAIVAAKYHCPMHPTVVSDKPGDCPICGMKLVLMDAANPSASTENNENAPVGLAPVFIAPAVRERMGLKLASVEKRDMAHVIRTSVRIVPDETRLWHVTVKIDGYVEQLFAATTGQYVQKGDPLLAIYSPMLVTAQQEYLNVIHSDPSLAATARKRLLLLDITGEQISGIEKTGKPEHAMILYAPTNGWIISRDIATGHRVMAGEQLLVLGDFSTLWADADIYQSDLPFVNLGESFELTTSALPGKTLAGKVAFISPVLEAETRTVRVRMIVPNPDLLLKPEMYGVAGLFHNLGEKIAVPESAVMRGGEHNYVFRDDGAGSLVPVDVKLGQHVDGWFEILAGLNSGDKVVTSANFLVDSESSIKAALNAVTGK